MICSWLDALELENSDSFSTPENVEEGTEPQDLPKNEVLENWSDWLKRTTPEALGSGLGLTLQGNEKDVGP